MMESFQSQAEIIIGLKQGEITSPAKAIWKKYISDGPQ